MNTRCFCPEEKYIFSKKIKQCEEQDFRLLRFEPIVWYSPEQKWSQHGLPDQVVWNRK